MRKRLFGFVVLLLTIWLVVACGPTAPEAPAPAETGGGQYRLAAIFPGVITDADYNTLGYIGITAVQADLGVEIAYSESVAVPDVERVMREYIDDGYNIVFTHGSQFLSQTQTLAGEFPEVIFIAESDAPLEEMPPNLWVIDRNFQVAFYPLAAVAAGMSQTGKVGYLGGLTLPFSYAEVHALEQAIADQSLNIELQPVWVGDFNDPTKARELAEAMIAEDVDVIIGSLNLGMFGVFEAVKASEKQVWVTAKYTDKTSFAPDHYLTSTIYDFVGPLKEIVGKIQAGETGGYYPLGFDTGVAIQPLQNAPAELNDQVQQIATGIASGEIEVVKDATPIE